MNDALACGEHVDRCPVCDSDEFFIRKDFPQKLGMGIVIVSALIALAMAFFVHDIYFFAVLFSIALVDVLIYRFVAKITVCYRCRCEFRECPIDPNLGGFDLATAEKYSEQAPAQEEAG